MISVGGNTELVSEYKSVVYRHQDSPRWYETFKIAVPIEEFYNCHLKFIFRHKSGSEGTAVWCPLYHFSWIVSSCVIQWLLWCFRQRPCGQGLCPFSCVIYKSWSDDTAGRWPWPTGLLGTSADPSLCLVTLDVVKHWSWSTCQWKATLPYWGSFIVWCWWW